ncbi:PepSY domain-containing protein [Xanthomonas bundabergensis]|uniref:PepSY domain-containing protein n=1 Tax=Xanthomonas bundabergensis TaxID=3160842 RepID=UPI0035131F75
MGEFSGDGGRGCGFARPMSSAPTRHVKAGMAGKKSKPPCIKSTHRRWNGANHPAQSQVKAPSHGGAALTQSQVKALLSEQGYTKLDRLKFEDGLWKTEATSGDGKRGEVRVGPRGGRVYAEGVPSKLSASEVDVPPLSVAGLFRVRVSS